MVKKAIAIIAEIEMMSQKGNPRTNCMAKALDKYQGMESENKTK